MASVQMPRLSDSMETGKILRWLKKEGEDVKKGEPLVEIESDKANIEVEAYASGKLSKIVVPEGESAPIGAVIAEIGDVASASKTAPQGQAPAAEPRQDSRPAAAEAPKSQATAPAAHVAQANRAAAATAQTAADAGGEQYPHGGPDDRTEVGAAAQAALNVIRRPVEHEDGERQRVSPVARRLAEEHGVDCAGSRAPAPVDGSPKKMSKPPPSKRASHDLRQRPPFRLPAVRHARRRHVPPARSRSSSSPSSRRPSRCALPRACSRRRTST